MPKILTKGLICSMMLILLACTQATVSDSGFKVLLFEQGKMKQSGNTWVIYEPGEKMDFKENGVCVYNKIKYACMWHGFILKYDAQGQDVVLDCVTSQSEPAYFGSPKEITQADSSKLEYSFALKGSENNFINPQYLIGQRDRKSSVMYSETACQVKGVEVLRFKQVFQFNDNSPSI